MLEVLVLGVRMTTINGINNNNSVMIPVKQNVNFRAQAPVPQDNEVDTFIKQQEKARKNAKKQQNLNTGIQVAILAMLGASVGLMAKQYGLFKKFKLAYKDLSKEAGLEELALPKSLKDL